MTKTEARKYYKKMRGLFSPQAVEENSAAILSFLKQFDFIDDNIFHCFLPIEKNNEINTFPIVDWIFHQKMQVVLPLVDGQNLTNCLVEEGYETKLNSLQIPEPISYKEIDSENIDVVLIPMFVCDKKGNRVGYGGGYYDRFLLKCKPSIKKIGLSYFKPIDDVKDTHSSDLKLDYCVTPLEIVSFTSFNFLK